MSQAPNALPVPAWPDTERHARILAACPLLEPLFRRHAEARHIPGVAYGVVVAGELLFTHSFGVRNVATGAPVDADTVFRIASMTKSFVALAILQLRDAGKLRLDEPVATYVSELATLPYPTSDSPAITVRQLLSMTVGWPQDDPWGDRQLYRTDAAMSDFYRAGVSWSNPPGVTYEYSNYAYMVLGRIITNVAGMPAIQYINQQILKPLGMTATVWNGADVPAERLALGYRWEDETWKEEALLPSGGDVAAFAGLFTSVRDLARWVALFQAAWPPRSEPENGPLRRSSLREMQRAWSFYEPVVTVPALGAVPAIVTGGYGFGLSLRHNGQWPSVGHGGGLPGFGSHMRWAPDYGIGIVALGNLTYAGVSEACVKGLELLVAKSQVQPYQRPVAPALAAARDSVLQLLQRWDSNMAETLFADNFFLDRDLAHWRRALAQLDERHGALTLDGPFVVENWLRGEWRMRGERGWCRFALTMSPTVPPRVQELEMESTLPPSVALQQAAERLVALVAQPTRRALKTLCAADVDLTARWDQVRLANILCGSGALGEVTGGDGATWVGFTFLGSKGNAKIRLTVNERGKATDLSFCPL
ncbi:MAG: class A beta-lactamase-related serine hydrolase [Caldilinea sp. CFX5]|nr:class A beta-lactamase-related serine hydrolase [Caldilinea sp. CFX5]